MVKDIKKIKKIKSKKDKLGLFETWCPRCPFNGKMKWWDSECKYCNNLTMT